MATSGVIIRSAANGGERRPCRKRWMVGGRGLAIAVFAVWLLVLRPLFAWRVEAADDRRLALAELGETRASLKRLASSPSKAALPADGLEPLARSTAEAAGLTIVTGMDPSGRLGFQVSSASSAALFGWLAEVTRTGSAQIIRLGVTENADATLNAEGALAPAS